MKMWISPETWPSRLRLSKFNDIIDGLNMYELFSDKVVRGRQVRHRPVVHLVTKVKVPFSVFPDSRIFNLFGGGHKTSISFDPSEKPQEKSEIETNVSSLGNLNISTNNGIRTQYIRYPWCACMLVEKICENAAR